jgi:protein O-mannosyl-transferase
MTAVKDPSSPQSRHRIFPPSVPMGMLMIVVLGCLAYANAIRHPFVHDDIVFIVQNPSIARWDNIGDSFLNSSIPQSFQGLVTPYYRPVLEVFYRLQYALFGFNPHGFHLFNVVVHVANGLLVFGILRMLLKNNAAAFLIATIFVVHPVQTQAVACIAGISNVLCAFFSLTALYFYLRSSEQSDHRRKLIRFAASLGFFIVALFTKEQAVCVLGVIVLYEIFLNGRPEPLMTRLYRLAILGVAAAGYLSCRHLLFGAVTSAVFENMAELKLRLLAIPTMIEMFMGILLVPVGLHYYRSADILAPYVRPCLLFIFLTGLTVVLIARLPREDRGKALFGLGWFAVFLLPVLNIVPLVNEYSFIAASEHGLYLPMVGFFIFLTAVMAPYSARIPSGWMKTALAVVIVLLCLMTARQNTFWRGEIPLFERALAFEPQLGRVHVLLAKAYVFNGRPDKAVNEFNQAAVIMTEYARKATTPKARRFYEGFLKGIYADSAKCYLAQRDPGRAVESINKAIAIDAQDHLLYTNRALVLIMYGRLSDGIADLERALELNPGNLIAANNLSIAYIQAGQKERARDLLQWILVRDPAFAAARRNLEQLESSRE